MKALILALVLSGCASSSGQPFPWQQLLIQGLMMKAAIGAQRNSDMRLYAEQQSYSFHMNHGLSQQCGHANCQ